MSVKSYLQIINGANGTQAVACFLLNEYEAPATLEQEVVKIQSLVCNLNLFRYCSDTIEDPQEILLAETLRGYITSKKWEICYLN